jgi:hypothetical protein
MSNKPELNEHEEWEMRVQKISREFEFPVTPNLAKQVQRQLNPAPRSLILGRAVGLILVLLLAIMVAVPEIRASVLEFLSIGAMQFINTTNSSLSPSPAPTAGPTPSLPLLEFGRVVSLEEAQAEVAYPIPLPIEPYELGNPDLVYLQESQMPVVVLIWDKPVSLDTPQLMLYIFDSSDTFFKFAPDEPQFTTVNENRAVWLTSPHLMEYMEQSGELISREVVGSVLIWEQDGLTYRLEGSLRLEQAVQIAEALP